MTISPASHLVLLEWPLGRNAGGPSGYLWHLRHGLHLAGFDQKVQFVAPESHAAIQRKAGLLGRLEVVARKSDLFWRLLKTYGPTTVAREARQFQKSPISDYFASPAWEALLADGDVRSVHCHTTLDGLRVHNSLTRLGRRNEVRLILTSHCPEMPAHEKADIMRNNGLTAVAEHLVREKLLEIDTAAISRADTLVFPCPEALEPYLKTFPPFEALLRGKDVRYVFTGIDEPTRGAAVTGVFPEEERTLKLFYAGRHNPVKGYDLLSRLIPRFLDSTDAVMVVAGRQGPLFAPNHPRWLELGWINNAPDIIAAADAFLLPNTQTYFDLVALEVLAVGCPLLASRTGGNKALAALSPGVILFDPDDESLSNALTAFALLSPAARRALGQANRTAYETHFSAVRFGEAYYKAVLG